MRILRYITLFIWLIGIATLIAGVTGISNIMLITVRERTREFGIRKALGARPRQIVSLVLLESVAIALVFGYIGMLVGTLLTKGVDAILKMSGGDGAAMFKDPTVDFKTVLMATFVMVIAGMIAGYIPAKRAVSIKPVEALAAN
jgi:putative ABC transport system permease protein